MRPLVAPKSDHPIFLTCTDTFWPMNFSSVFRFGRSPGKLQIAHDGPQHQLDIAKGSDSSTRPVSTCLDLSRAISAENEFSKSASFLRRRLATNQKVSVRPIIR